MATDVQPLIKAAIEARDKAYAPYSNHPVGAAVLTAGGQVFAGCNVENAAYPLGTCAEAGAIAAMVLSGEREIAHVVVVGPGDVACTPCGGCRQKIREFAGATGKPVTICDRDGNILLETTSGALLPHSFGPENIDEAKADQ